MSYEQAASRWPDAASTTHIVDFDTSQRPPCHTAAPTTLGEWVAPPTRSENDTLACDGSGKRTEVTVAARSGLATRAPPGRL